MTRRYFFGLLGAGVVRFALPFGRVPPRATITINGRIHVLPDRFVAVYEPVFPTVPPGNSVTTFTSAMIQSGAAADVLKRALA